MTETKLSLVGKLAEACDAVGGVEKKGTNEMQRYKYVKAADVAKAIRHELFSRGVVIIPNEKELVETGQIPTKSGGMLREFRLTVDFLIMDSTSEEKITVQAYGVAMDSGDKAIYKCKTGATKYFLRALGLIPDEKDDPEADETVDAGVKDADYEKQFDQRTADQQAIAPFQITAIDEACKRTGKTEAEVLAYLNLIGHKRIEHLLKSEFNDFLRWSNSKTAPKQESKIGQVKASVGQLPLKTGTEVALEKARKRMWATATEHSIPEGDVKTCAYERYKVKSTNDLTLEQYNDMTTWIEDVARAVSES